MDVNTELPLYAIAIIGSFLQHSFAHIFMNLGDYSKHGSYYSKKILDIDMAKKISDIDMARSLSLWLWIICIVCVGGAVFLYLFPVEWFVISVVRLFLSLLFIISIGAVVLIAFVVCNLQMPFLRYISNSAV